MKWHTSSYSVGGYGPACVQAVPATVWDDGTITQGLEGDVRPREVDDASILRPAPDPHPSRSAFHDLPASYDASPDYDLISKPSSDPPPYESQRIQQVAAWGASGLKRMKAFVTPGHSLGSARSKEWWDQKKFDELLRLLKTTHGELANFSLQLGRLPEEIPALAREWNVNVHLLYHMSRKVGVEPRSLNSIKKRLAKAGGSWLTARSSAGDIIENIEPYIWTARAVLEERYLLGELLRIASHANIDISRTSLALVHFLKFDHGWPTERLRRADFARFSSEQTHTYAEAWRQAVIWPKAVRLLQSELNMAQSRLAGTPAPPGYFNREMPVAAIARVADVLLETLEAFNPPHRIARVSLREAETLAREWQSWPSSHEPGWAAFPGKTPAFTSDQSAADRRPEKKEQPDQGPSQSPLVTDGSAEDVSEGRGQDYSPEYMRRLQQSEERAWAEIGEHIPAGGADSVSSGDLNYRVDAHVNEMMWPYFLAELNAAKIPDVTSLGADDDSFFRTLLGKHTHPKIKQRIRERLGVDPTVERIRAHMGHFLESEFRQVRQGQAPISNVTPYFPAAETSSKSAHDGHVRDIPRMGSHDNHASDRVPELFSQVFGVPIEIWQPRHRRLIGPPNRDVIPMVVLRKGDHFYAAGTRHQKEPTLVDPPMFTDVGSDERPARVANDRTHLHVPQDFRRVGSPYVTEQDGYLWHSSGHSAWRDGVLQEDPACVSVAVIPAYRSPSGAVEISLWQPDAVSRER